MIIFYYLFVLRKPRKRKEEHGIVALKPQIGRGTAAETPVRGAQDFAALQRLDF